MSSFNPRLLLPAVAIAGSLAAQDRLSAAVTDADPRIAVHSNDAQPGERPYGTWAAGAAYKASFHGGMTFYPLLGRDYPRNQPWSWRTTSVRVGNGELLDEGVAPVMSHTEYRVEYALGPVVEAYDVRAEGLEQTFVLAQRPGHGDLSITGRVQTSLWTAPVAELHGDLLFHDEAGTPLVRYGRALAIDADGDTFAMTTTCQGDTITLRLPAAALEQADFPLVVDPLMGAVQSMTLTSMVDLGEIDGACESLNTALNGAYCVTRHYSATDADVIARICAANFSNATTRYSDLSAATSDDHGRVAFLPATNKWVVAYQSLTLATQIMQVRVAMFSGGTTTPVTTSSVGLVPPAGDHHWRPCVGGIAAGGAGTQALVAFQRETGTTTFAEMPSSDVFASLFQTSSALGSFGTPFVVHDAMPLDCERPSINRAAEGGAAFSWMVMCQGRYATITPHWDLQGRLVSNAGTVSNSVFGSVSPDQHELGPLVDGRDGRYLVTYAVVPSTVAAPTDVRGVAIQAERLYWPHGRTSPVGSGFQVQTLQQHTLRILETGGIAYHGSTKSHWTLAWRSSSTAPAVYAVRVGYTGSPLQAPELVASTTATIPGWPTVANDDDDDVTTIAFQRHQGTTGEVSARTWINPPVSGPQLSPGNCSTALLQWLTPAGQSIFPAQWVGSELSQVRVTSAPANALHVMLVGTGTTNQPIVNPSLIANCTLLVPLSGAEHLGFLPIAVGSSAEWTVPLPEWLPAMTLHFQDWIMDPADGLFRVTRLMSVPLLK